MKRVKTLGIMRKARPLLKTWRHDIAFGVRAGLLMVALALSGNVLAHDFWLEIEPGGKDPSSQRSVTIRTGRLFTGDSVPRVDDWFERFAVIRPDGTEAPVGGVIGDDPAGRFELEAPGTYTVLYDSTSGYSELDGPHFTQYLADEGLDEIIALRAERGETDAVAREVYFRHAKALIARDSDVLEDAPRGQALELIMRAVTPDGYRFALQFRDAPVAGVRVVVLRKGQATKVFQANTDSAGQVTLPIHDSGYYLVKAVHATPAPPDSGLTQWISYWASSTFEHVAKN